jgi:hypothetical protein
LEDKRNDTTIQETGKIRSHLAEYPCISKFLGRFIERGRSRFLVDVLNDESSSPDVKRLEKILRLGESHCEDFGAIFRERKAHLHKNMDSEVIDLLAEVRAFEFLNSSDFKEIKKIKRAKDMRTVDFTTVRSSQIYAVEVTRLGLSSSDSKKPVYIKNKADVKMVFGPDNRPIFSKLIRDAAERKYNQIKIFCNKFGGNYRGIIVVSAGRDYFISNEYVNNVMNMLPESVRIVLEQEWGAIGQGREYLNHLVMILGKKPSDVIVYPSID